MAQWPGDPPWPPPGCRAVTGITTWRSEEEKQKGSFVLYPALCWVAGHSWVACSMFSYLNIYTIQFHFTNLSFNAIWLLYHCLGNGKGIIFFFLRINIIFIPEFYKSEQMKGKMVGCVMRWTRTQTKTTSAEADQLTVTRNIQTGPSSHSHLANIFSS